MYASLSCGWTGAAILFLSIVCLFLVVGIPIYFVQRAKKIKLDNQQQEDQGPYRDKGDSWKGLYR